MTKVVSFLNNKGGVGKTTTVAAMAHFWASFNQRILLIDLDSQANLTSIITQTDPTTKEWERTIEDAFLTPEFGIPIEHVTDKIDIIPTDLDLSNFEKDTARFTGREYLLADLLERVKDQYDLVLIDCPPALGLITYNALVASDGVVLVTNCDSLSYRGMKMILQLCKEVASNNRLNPKLMIYGIAVTRYEKNNLSELYLKRIKDELGNLVLDPPIRKATKVAQATSFSVSLIEYDPQGRATQDYLRMAKELVQRIVLE